VKAIQLRRVGAVQLEELDMPEPRAEEILVRVTAAGMCGSDRHLVSGEYPGRPPVVLGHEFEGVVVGGALNAEVVLGARVTVDPNVSCGVCSSCRSGLVAHCQHLSAYGVDRDGGFAEHVRVLRRQAHVLPAEVPAQFGALCEPLSCCLRGMDRADIQPGQSVVVVGGGIMGQLLAQLARLAGARIVVLSTRQRARRELAESLGATASVDPTEVDPATAVTGRGGISPGGVDVVFDAAGAPGSFEQAIALARPAGTVVVVGAAPQELEARIRPFHIFERELRIVGSHLNPFTHQRAAQLVASPDLRLQPLITETVDLAELARALQRGPRAGEIKLIAAP
jgi:L-iditol 2-dehydrogenase